MTDIASYKNHTAAQNVETALQKAQQIDAKHALLSLTPERARARAAQVDSDEITGPLAGVPFVVKDNFLAFGAPTTAASRFLENFEAPLQATAVERLEAAGAICIGKANLDAFAHGGSTENSAFGPTKNAIDDERVAGGSSGGSAVVAALDVVPFALGTDTGGSIRQPASFNGVIGIKPTYGTVSRFGVVAMASSTDTIGTFATTIDDAELVMSIMTGQDKKDMTTIKNEIAPTVADSTPKKIGLIRDLMGEGVDPEVTAAIEAYADELRAAGHTVELVDLPMARYAVAMYYIIVPAEVSSNLARYDGVRYGKRAESSTLAELYGRSRDEGFMPENKRRIMIGSFVLSSGFFDAYYQQAQKARTLLIREFDQLFADYDFLLSPTAPTPAFKLGENSEDPVKMYLADAMTIPPSLAGLPAYSVPAGQSTSGLPIGAQWIGPRGSDQKLFSTLKHLEPHHE